MLSDLQKQWEKADRARAAILASVGALQADAQEQSQGENWSPLQIVEHLTLASEQMGDAVSAASAQAGLLPDRKLGTGFLVGLGAFLMHTGVPLSSPKAMMPKGNASLAALTARWDLQWQALGARLEEITPKKRKRTVALHPMLGPLTAYEVLRLTYAHHVYHLKQVERQEK